MIHNIFTVFNHIVFWGLLVHVYRKKGKAFVQRFAETYNDELDNVLGERHSLQSAIKSISELYDSEASRYKVYEKNILLWCKSSFLYEEKKEQTVCSKEDFEKKKHSYMYDSMLSDFSKKLLKSSEGLSVDQLSSYIQKTFSSMADDIS